MPLNPEFWHAKSVFLTGHTGFKGGWLAAWLLSMGARVTGYALAPETDPSFFSLCGLGGRMSSIVGDVRASAALGDSLAASNPEVVFHFAAQPLVRRSYREPALTFETNVMGTVNLLEAVRKNGSTRAVVIVTSDKCYENRESAVAYHEDDQLGGRDPYSASKACAELVVGAYRRSFFDPRDLSSPAVATVRAGNVIGGGDWAEDRIVPDAVRAIHRGDTLIIRSPDSVRPWQHVLDPLGGYLMLAERLADDGQRWSGAWNFGPDPDGAVTVAELVGKVIGRWGSGAWRVVAPKGAPHEARMLGLDCRKARDALGWSPRLPLDAAVALTVRWYQAALSNPPADMFDLTCAQIRDYMSDATSLEILHAVCKPVQPER